MTPPLASGLWPLASGLWPLASGLWPHFTAASTPAPLCQAQGVTFPSAISQAALAKARANGSLTAARWMLASQTELELGHRLP